MSSQDTKCGQQLRDKEKVLWVKKEFVKDKRKRKRKQILMMIIEKRKVKLSIAKAPYEGENIDAER